MKDFIHIWNISNVSQLDQKVYPGFKSGETSKKASTHAAYEKTEPYHLSDKDILLPITAFHAWSATGNVRAWATAHFTPAHVEEDLCPTTWWHLQVFRFVRLRDDKPCSCWWKDPHLGDSCQSIRDIGKFQASWWRKVSGEFARNLGGDVALAKIQDNFTISCGQLVPTI